MRMPEMILFDYGHTLLSEPGSDPLRGQRALSPYVTRNPRGLGTEEICAFSTQLFKEAGAARAGGFELHNFAFQRLLYESLGIEFSLSWAQAERVFWDGMSPGAVMPGAREMLLSLQALGIRTGVVSNISFSGESLRERLCRLLPDSRFEFVIASSEYMVRKPNPRIFRLALQKAGLSPDRVWFCGDNVRADVEGAHAAGLFPVWYEGESGEPDYDVRLDPLGPPRCPHLHIRRWCELTERLQALAQPLSPANFS